MSQTSLAELLSLASPPVAIAFVDAAPPGVPHVPAVEPAGCGYWRRAAAGEVFFTVADDHKRCVVGAHTHNVTLSPPEKQELMGLCKRWWAFRTSRWRMCRRSRRANQEMEKFHRGRAAATPTA